MPTSGRDAERPTCARAHTVFDRTLLRAGETVSMKHFVRTETGAGLALPPPERAARRAWCSLHVGSGQEFTSCRCTWRGADAAP